MKTIEEIVSEWKEDSTLDSTDIYSEIIRTPSLHAKYIDYYSEFRRSLASAERKRSRMAFMKRKYYRGECTKEELDNHGWKQYTGLKASSSELTQLLSMDLDMTDLDAAVAGFKIGVSTLEYILKQISQRDYSLKTAFDVQKFLSGA